jgi:hypothetical protein
VIPFGTISNPAHGPNFHIQQYSKHNSSKVTETMNQRQDKSFSLDSAKIFSTSTSMLTLQGFNFKETLKINNRNSNDRGKIWVSISTHFRLYLYQRNIVEFNVLNFQFKKGNVTSTFNYSFGQLLQI